ncbi:MAG: hypothetical protein OXH61_03005 [Acidimicrobiaceae bacterium]|nr:hypothetical protein [Acidimicrobiaceae bacterium]
MLRRGSTSGASGGEPLVMAPLTAADIPACMADDDGRGRIVELRELCKQWAHADHAHRVAMIAEPPRRFRWWHRVTRRREDLARIASVVHALCDRDGVPVPDWVWEHRARKHRGLSEHSSGFYIHDKGAPRSCEYHRVWFDPASIEDHRVHGFTKIGL